ncbi:DUF5713 family protein [Metasolibacillus meyeri]|uniref:DUF5713 family protein n=1 Tax=Metasolibacillus meyeri TaxID=1071052 RepID=A0AAW9NQN2_9BACL|nr:DUF5713 family protein [Metasolibacillus meyeri]MEC1176986.1 DUF5713 family protein [Metasolibacillus meyeri]
MKEIIYLKDMYQDNYYPTFLVDKIKVLLEGGVHYLEQGSRSLEEIQAKFDQITLAINDLEDEFYEHNSELETVARDSIAETVIEILQAYNIELDVEDALREREW